ncbi:RHS repeat domain-containing protein [Victivallis sp. Marseille-Q1083]|uniref:RHS repeat domain-containing protein n=1 Tax=Victivallis sp. Marseille-Q1083 TaxID=2717288 RepID=UPI00158E5008|nr:RHS repeat protein [Victivallis sp. Marseille-Q1083]
MKKFSMVTHYEYAATGELTKQYGDDAYPVSYEYDADGRLTKLTTYRNYPQPGDSTAFAYDADDRIATRTDAAGQATSYTYDAGGRLLTRTWANGVVTTYSYDNGGTPTGVNYSDDTAAIAMTLTRLGETATLTDAAGTHHFTYNADRTVATESQPLLTNGELVFSYDALGRPTGLTLKQGTAVELSASYSYDAMSRLATVTGLGHTATYSRVSGSNRLASTEFKVGTTTVHTATRGYDHFNRLTDVNGYGYTYNARDQRTKQTLIDGQYWEYSYDELGQVISGVKKTAAGVVVSGQNYAYAYDTVGNRETATANAVETNYTANQLNQYTAIGSIIPTYDVNGNLLTGYNGWTMEWNGENRLKAIYNATTRLEFAYDYNGRRFSKKTYAKSGADWVLSSEKKFIYDGFKQIAEYNGTTLVQAYVWQPAGSGDFDVPLWMKAGSNVYTYVTDGNKNIRQLKNAAGTAVATYDYDPFGNVSATGSVSCNPWQFSSEFRDAETGLIYYNYRYYAPTIGRWINKDLFEERGGVNLYAILQNNLIAKWDWRGQFDGLAPWVMETLGEWLGFFKKCCNGINYDTRKKCCCNGKLYDKSEKFVIDIYYGYKTTSGPIEFGIPYGLISHAWLEWDGGSAGFYGYGYGDSVPTEDPGSSALLFGAGIGNVRFPEGDNYISGPKMRLEHFEFSACRYDLEKLKNTLILKVLLDKTAPPYYDFYAVNCLTWAAAVVYFAEDLSRCELD